jgi:hypothetical protein
VIVVSSTELWLKLLPLPLAQQSIAASAQESLRQVLRLGAT